MADISQSNWVETDGSNNSTPPDGWPSVTMLPNQVEPAARAIMGAVKRWWDRANGAYTSTGASGAYVITPSYNAWPTAYVQGEVYDFYADKDSAGGDTFQISNANSLVAKAIYVMTQDGAVALLAKQIKSGQFATLQYSTALDGFILQNPALIGESGATTVNSTGGTVALTKVQARVPTILVTGALTSNLTITVPAGVGVWSWTILNETTGAFSVTLQNAAGGTGVAVPQGYLTVVESDSTNMNGFNAYIAAQLASYAPLLSPALTGIPTAPTAATGTNTTQIATTAFVQQTAFASALPVQPGGVIPYVPVSNGGVVAWQIYSNDTANFLAGVI